MAEVDTSMPHNIETRFRNIEAHLGVGSTDEDTGQYSVETHESLVPPEPDIPAPVAPGAVPVAPAPPKTVAELEAELKAARAREGGEATYESMNATQLKDELEVRGLDTTGTKDELMTRLEEDDATSKENA